MKKIRCIWFNIKIHTSWRLQFILGLARTTLMEKFFSHDKNNG